MSPYRTWPTAGLLAVLWGATAWGMGSMPRVPEAADLAIVGVEAPARACRNEITDVRVVLRSSGYAGTAVVVLHDTNRQEAASAEVEVTAGGGLKIRLPFSVGAGPTETWTLRVHTPVPDGCPTNDRASFTVQVVDRRIRVLLIQQQPDWEYRYARQVLEADPAVELSGLTQLSTGEWSGDGAKPPTAGRGGGKRVPGVPALDAAALADFDVVVLGETAAMARRSKSVPAWLRPFVESGGGLMLAQVSDDDPWAGQPPRSGGKERGPRPADGGARMADRRGRGKQLVAAQPTEAGLDHPVTRLEWDRDANRQAWGELSRVTAGALSSEAELDAVLLVHASVRGRQGGMRGLLSAAEVEKGRLLYSAIDDTWRWRSPVRADIDYHARFWRQAVRWLAGVL